MIREQIVVEARKWIGTPYKHNQALLGVGVDCIGLVVAVGMALKINGDFNKESFLPYQGYSPNPNPNKMIKGMREFLTPVESPQIGDIAWIEPRQGMPSHLAIKSGDNAVIHACATAGKVVEASYPDRINSWWRYGGLNE